MPPPLAALLDHQGARLRYQVLPCPEAPRLVCLHGLGCHGGWLLPLAERLQARGVEVVLVDQRGSGASSGARGDIDHRRTWVEDACAVVRHLRADDPRPLFLEGSSSGAIVAFAAAAELGADVSGLVLLSPALQSKAGVVPWYTQLALAACALFAPGTRFRYPARYVDEGLTTDVPESLARIRTDPLYVREATARMTLQLFWLTQRVARAASRCLWPVLMLQGERDRVCEARAARRFFERLGSPQKQWRSYPEGQHGLELSARPLLERLAEDLASWLHSMASTHPYPKVGAGSSSASP